ncbi:hypothetical protein WJX75_005766 [Coccomyxa subellipsoidea]|uniref:S-adenosyl-L-methionine-dependent methyltransferase n=1 Tax=Coccomyxa subellipsoidea TaxID=248742 RepID=A0ABR2YMZ2_9CHLO
MEKNIFQAHEEALEKNDIDNFVSFTAITVSAGRLAEGMRDDPLYKDTLIADILKSSEAIQAAARDFREIVVKQQESNKEAHVVNMVVQRTRYLDDKLLEGLATMPTDNNVIGIKRQVVLLGSGLDTKAWRLDFPSGTAIFEVDQRDMSGFKQRRLAASKAQMDAASDVAGFKHPLKVDSWALVGTDLMHPDWVADLDSSGFQKGLPTAFVAEGLLYYLSPDAVKTLLSTLAAISGPGSVLLFSCINEAFYRGCKKDLTRNNESADGVVGLSATIRRFNEAFQFGMPNNVAGFLGPFGWDASADGAVKDVKNVYKAYSVQEFSPPKDYTFDKNKEENEKLFGPKQYFLVNARRAN